MKATLVSMPWQTFEMPAMPLGVLASHLGRVRPHVEIEQVYGTTAWAQFANVESRGLIGLEDYLQVANMGVYSGIGEWVFTSALYPDQDWPLERFAAFCERNEIDDYPHLLEMWSLAPAFIESLATEILSREPSLVGLSSTFSQNIASLALARCLKTKQPTMPIIMGGTNCDGVMGAALLRNFPVIDFVCMGEGEETLVEFIDTLDHNRALDGIEDLDKIAGLCWRSPDGAVVANAPRSSRFNLNEAPAPDFEPFFADLQERGMSRRIRKRIPYEASRGCWWGAKKHCTFCGLNATIMEFRSRNGDRVFSDIEELCRKHQSLDVVFVDNIFDLKYFHTLIPKLTAAGWDLRLFFETKSNLKEEQVAALADAHVAALQPGIESLSTDVLKLMRKGVDAAQNVLFLRAAEENSVTAMWNMLYGFRDETPIQYERVIRQIPNLCHLQPPSYSRIALMRFSPNFDDTDLGFGIRTVAPMYHHLFDLPDEELMDIAFFHQSESLGIGGEIERRLIEAIEQWTTAYPESSLIMYEDGGSLRVRDRRQLRDRADYEFSVPWQAELIRAARAGRGLERLSSHLSESGFKVDAASVAAFVDHLVEIGLLFVDHRDDGSNARYLALPLADHSCRKHESAHHAIGAST